MEHFPAHLIKAAAAESGRTREDLAAEDPRIAWASSARISQLAVFSTDMKGILVFAVLLLGCSSIPFISCNSEGDALHTFRRSLSDPDNVLQSWDPTLVNPCTWFHVTCNQDNSVTRVDLGNSRLSGHLVPELGELKHLQYLELYKNKISGKIPEELGKLTSLVSLDLYNNNLTGSIPESIGNLQSLIFLRVNNNQLSGQVPRALMTIKSLKVIDLSSNDLCGTIPVAGPFEHFPMKSFESNPRLKGPELLGLAAYDSGCD
ncbi:hypothetical protein L7F22_040208 [Adiantum nelumboides]|nr:hypothetical protein [Adiantum nelumboides]